MCFVCSEPATEEEQHEDKMKKRNVRDEVPKEVGGKLASVYYHASNMILPILESLVLIDIIYNHPNMRIVCSEPATEEEQMKMEGEKRNVREVPMEVGRQTIICLLPCFKLDQTPF